MVWPLGEDRDAAEETAGVVRSRENGVLEQRARDVVGAAIGEQHAARLQQLEAAQVNFLVATQGVRD